MSSLCSKHHGPTSRKPNNVEIIEQERAASVRT